MSNIQFTGTATQPQRNRKFCQFNKDQYCKYRKTFQNDSEKFRFFSIFIFVKENINATHRGLPFVPSSALCTYLLIGCTQLFHMVNRIRKTHLT